MSLIQSIQEELFVGQHVYCHAEGEHSQGIIVGKSEGVASRFFVLNFASYVRTGEISVMTRGEEELGSSYINDRRVSLLQNDERFLRLLSENNRELVLEFHEVANDPHNGAVVGVVFKNSAGTPHCITTPELVNETAAAMQGRGFSLQTLKDGTKAMLLQTELEGALQRSGLFDSHRGL